MHDQAGVVVQGQFPVVDGCKDIHRQVDEHDAQGQNVTGPDMIEQGQNGQGVQQGQAVSKNTQALGSTVPPRVGEQTAPHNVDYMVARGDTKRQDECDRIERIRPAVMSDKPSCPHTLPTTALDPDQVRSSLSVTMA